LTEPFPLEHPLTSILPRTTTTSSDKSIRHLAPLLCPLYSHTAHSWTRPLAEPSSERPAPRGEQPRVRTRLRPNPSRPLPRPPNATFLVLTRLPTSLSKRARRPEHVALAVHLDNSFGSRPVGDALRRPAQPTARGRHGGGGGRRRRRCRRQWRQQRQQQQQRGLGPSSSSSLSTTCAGREGRGMARGQSTTGSNSAR
jgi:hypothetical protein